VANTLNDRRRDRSPLPVARDRLIVHSLQLAMDRPAIGDRHIDRSYLMWRIHEAIVSAIGRHQWHQVATKHV